MKSKKRQKQGLASSRYWEIDALRGVAIVMMVIFHLLWDFWSFRIMPDIILYAGFWKYFQRTTAITFLILVGVSLTVSYRRSKEKAGGIKPSWRQFFWRGLRVFGIGMGFTIFGWISGFGYVHIGILHLIGLAIILSFPLLEYRWINLILWVIFVYLGSVVQATYLDPNWLVWFEPYFGFGSRFSEIIANIIWLGFVWIGIHRPDYYPLDYFPLFPWLGVVLLGVFLGNTFYGEHGRLILLPDWGDRLPVRALRFLGRHSLVIYVIHQPLMIAILYLLGYVA